MLNGFISGLFTAWVLSWFGVDGMIITSLKEVFNINISVSTYYIGFGLIGLISGLLVEIKMHL